MQSETGAGTAPSIAASAWEQIKTLLKHQLAPQEFENWVGGTSQLSYEDGSLAIQVADQVNKDFLEQEYSGQIDGLIARLELPVERIVYVPRAEARREPSQLPTSPASTRYVAEPAFASITGQLNPKFRFENFVVGSCNQFAHAAAQAVANSPSRTYNPLFIYGGVGMGKTHLMHAIGTALLERYPTIRVVYTSSERFMNEMVSCIKANRKESFRRHYRSADVLLIDDIQILAGREGTQEEFFHTFNELYESQKQIIISSDSPPKSMPGLVERLRSRFEWGLMVDVQPPDLETKMAILDKIAEHNQVHLPEDVRIFIATKTKSNVRELEGALVKLIAYSSMSHSPITLTMAQQNLKYLTGTTERRITMDSVLRIVADHFGLTPAQIKQKSNSRQIAYPRQIAMYLIKDLTHASLPEIGRMFAGKHHTTVLHSVQKIEKLKADDQDLNSLLHSLIDRIH
ncbi:MAG: chromosomal replication initiator protein DnaA [Bryobacteraceae bacterium]